VRHEDSAGYDFVLFIMIYRYITKVLYMAYICVF
jgi:hypothetical protein